MSLDITQMDCHALAKGDPRELAWATANAVSNVLIYADTLQAAAEYVANLKREDGEPPAAADIAHAIKWVLAPAAAKYAAARQKRS